jgi:hypothetical protein
MKTILLAAALLVGQPAEDDPARLFVRADDPALARLRMGGRNAEQLRLERMLVRELHLDEAKIREDIDKFVRADDPARVRVEAMLSRDLDKAKIQVIVNRLKRVYPNSPIGRFLRLGPLP